MHASGERWRLGHRPGLDGLRSAAFKLFASVFVRLFGTRIAAAIWHIPGAHAFYEWLMPRLRPNVATVDGHLMHLDRMDSLLLSVNGNYEADEQALFRSCLRPGDTVLDIGAHIGLYTLQAARAVGPRGRVIAFEPATENRELLERNVAENGYSNVTVVPAAVSESAGVALLALSAGNTGDHSLLAARTADRDAEEVETTTIDACTGGRPVDVIKIDVQGGEPLVLRGASETLAASIDVVLFTELSPVHLDDHGGAGAYLQQLVDAGFELFEVEGDRLLRGTAAELVSRPAATDGVHWDLVCAKGPGGRARLGL